ncbi:Rhodanese-like domain-containing protein [Phaeosphaeriaceae sp. PMI808]|nr:Rhodanese-like domain-containing protein [Phaeosphaeriaceae sp. PMI808]
MASKPTLPALLLHTYSSLLRRRAPQIQPQVIQLFGAELRSQSQDVWRRYVEAAPGGIERMSAYHKLQPIPVKAQAGFGQRRWYSVALNKSKIYGFEDVLAILKTPSSSQLLIDVREPHEFSANSIPTAINIPITSHPEALLLTEEEFQDQFGFVKPPLNKEIILFCKAGVRSRAAANIAQQAGYQNVGEYPGSWRDWEHRGGPGTKTPPKPEGRGEPQLPVTETKPVRGKGDSGEEDLGPAGSPPYPKGPMTPRQ